VENSGFGTLSRALSGLMSRKPKSQTGKRGATNAPAEKAGPAMSLKQADKKFASEGYTRNKSGTLSYRKANGGSPPNPTKKGK
jgi:hypothetical protein